MEIEVEIEEDENDLSDIVSSQSSDGNDSYVDDELESESVHMVSKVPSIVLDPPPVRSTTSSASIAASMMGIQRPIIPVINQTEARVIQNLSVSIGSNYKKIAPAFNAIAQGSTSMTFKTPQHIENFISSTTAATTTTTTSKTKAPSKRGGDRKSKKFKESRMNQNQNES